MKSNMAANTLQYQVENGTIGFLAPKNIHIDTRIKSIAALCPEMIANVDFKWRPF